MPYTISHAAIVLPFARLLARWRVLSAVVLGAMVPDFGLFFPWRVQRFETHSTLGLFSFCLPVGLVCYWLFQYVIKTPLIEALPEGPYARWRPFASVANIGSLKQWVLAAVGVLAGAVTHLVWDAFTHENARGVRMIPWLEEPVDIGSHRMGGVRLLQDGSSLIGLVIVGVLVLYALRRGRAAPVPGRLLQPPQRWGWDLAYITAAPILSGGWWLLARLGEPVGHSVKAVATGIAVAALRGLAMSLLVTSVALGWRLRALRAASARSAP
jgi:hypothetical protein